MGFILFHVDKGMLIYCEYRAVLSGTIVHSFVYGVVFCYAKRTNVVYVCIVFICILFKCICRRFYNFVA